MGETEKINDALHTQAGTHRGTHTSDHSINSIKDEEIKLGLSHTLMIRTANTEECINNYTATHTYTQIHTHRRDSALKLSAVIKISAVTDSHTRWQTQHTESDVWTLKSIICKEKKHTQQVYVCVFLYVWEREQHHIFFFVFDPNKRQWLMFIYSKVVLWRAFLPD